MAGDKTVEAFMRPPSLLPLRKTTLQRTVTGGTTSAKARCCTATRLQFIDLIEYRQTNKTHSGKMVLRSNNTLRRTLAPASHPACTLGGRWQRT
jgi:hypothetical protein